MGFPTKNVIILVVTLTGRGDNPSDTLGDVLLEVVETLQICIHTTQDSAKVENCKKVGPMEMGTS